MKIQNYKTAIKQISLKELQTFVLEYASNNEKFRNEIELFFLQEKKDEINISFYQKGIVKIYNKHIYNEYIHYEQIPRLISELNQTYFSSRKEYLKKKYYSEAFSIAAATIMESIKTYELVHTSDDIEYLIVESFKTIKEILSSNPSKKLTENIHNWVRQELKKPIYKEYFDDEFEMLEEVFIESSILLGNSEVKYQVLDERIKEYSNSEEWNSEMQLKKYLLRKYKLLLSDNKNEEAQLIVSSYLYLKDFRDIKIDQLYSEDKFDETKRVLLDGIIESEGIKHDIEHWKKRLLFIYEQQGEIVNYKALLKELFLENTPRVEYFKLLKGIISKEDWIIERKRLLREVRKSSKYSISEIELFRLYKMEDMKKELWARLNTPYIPMSIIIEYTPFLKDEFGDGLIKIYNDRILKEAENTGRSHYERIADYLCLMSSIPNGTKTTVDLTTYLLQTYNTRRAMREVFDKLPFIH